MVNQVNRYMAVSLDVTDFGLDMFAQISTVDVWGNENGFFPNNYTFKGDRCLWTIHANTELTSKVISMLGEQMDDICAKQAAINDRRKISKW